ncbi:glucoamylase family protein [Mesorhizobium sp.]|uniref:glucoamylase family protein n=1 Tax=Mesorhizobium sp. TaxID=1871066 RepID=UPI003BA93713
MLDGEPAALSDEELLDRLQRAAFDYFVENVNPKNGLVADTSRPNSPASIAVVGFGLSCYPIGVERGWMTRAAAVELTLATLRFFHGSEQGNGDDVTGHKGFYYHFLDMHTGRRVWRCELSMVDTALLIAGVLVAGTYFSQNNDHEREIRDLAEALYKRVDWRWAQGSTPTLRQGWKPKSGFLHYGWEGYNEATILYVLSMASPDSPSSDDSYAGWTATYQWENIYGYDVLYGGPLFMHQFSHAWIDFQGIRDAFMREKNSDYFENSRRSTYLHRDYARHNPYDYGGYSDNLWGLSAGDGPGGFRASVERRPHRFSGYAARGAPFGPDDGTIAPWSYPASLPFAPEICLPALRHLLDRYPGVVSNFRLPSGFNPTLANRRKFGRDGWVSEGHYGLDQGITVMMIENHRSRLLWTLMRSNQHIRRGLLKAGFTGGWLAQPLRDGSDAA